MATEISSRVSVEYGTGTHFSERLEPANTGAPAQMCWRDIHPPGLKVLPKGSPPASAGEINWEDTLGGKLAHAIKQLEGLHYAVFGSRPAAYVKYGGYDKCDWPDRLHPRCLWGPEFWDPQIITGPTGCNFTGTCWDYEVKEHAALGDSPYGAPHPVVPVRSRSGDPLSQFQGGSHDREYFPVGAVSRDDGAQVHDPAGKGWFGATNPGRDDAATNPWLKTANGYMWVAGDSIQFRWTKPADVTTPDSVRLYYKLKPPGGSWSSLQSQVMTPSGGTWIGALGPYRHGTEVRWCLRYSLSDPYTVIWDPLGVGFGGPADADMYYLQWYTHYNPYGNGLPEMLDDYGSWGDVRHGTDYFEFDGSETIQWGLIAFLRQVISMLTGRTCYNRYEQCSEGAAHPGAMHHSPRLRTTSWSYCCISWPIMFYWSGSAPYPHYQRRGKGEQDPTWGPLDTRPLTNMDTEPNHGLQASRMSWRGVEPVFGDSPFSNPRFGRGASWQVRPFEHKLFYAPLLGLEADVWAKYEEANLRAGDVIDAVHIQEIIDAVAYLINHGVWTTYPTKSCKKTAGSYVGKPIGYSLQIEEWKTQNIEGNEYERRELYYPCANCCADTSYCEPAYSDNYYYLISYIHTFYEWDEPSQSWVQRTISNGGYWENPYNLHCDPIPEPSWEDCWNQEGDCIAGQCTPFACHTNYCQNMTHDLHAAYHGHWSYTGAFGGGGVMWYCDIPQVGGAEYYCGRYCYFYDDWCDEYFPCTSTGCSGSEMDRCTATGQGSCGGLSFFTCTGPACMEGGWDDTHGNPFLKARLDHTWSPGLSSVATGPPGNELSGNCLGDIYVCGTLAEGEHPNIGFQERRGVDWDGSGETWYHGICDCTAEIDGGCPRGAPAWPPGIPGFDLYDLEGDPLCVYRWHEYYGAFDAEDAKECSFSAEQFSPCKGESAWAAVNLNLDGTGTPYRNYAGIDNDQEPYTGPGIPTVTPYDLTKDPATWMHGCPCETWTGEGTCT